jgi:hypothetical protein
MDLVARTHIIGEDLITHLGLALFKSTDSPVVEQVMVLKVRDLERGCLCTSEEA